MRISHIDAIIPTVFETHRVTSQIREGQALRPTGFRLQQPALLKQKVKRKHVKSAGYTRGVVESMADNEVRKKNRYCDFLRI